MTAYHRRVTSEDVRASVEDGELLDVLTTEGETTGVRKNRGSVHRDGDWHRAIHIWIVREDGLVLLQRRAFEKDIEPGKLDVSVAGHYAAGELFIDVLREADEELGVTLRPGQLEYLGTAKTERRYDLEGGELIDREFQEVYVTRNETDLDEYRLKRGEVEELLEVSVERAIRLFGEGEHTPATGYDVMRRPVNALLHAADLPVLGRELHAESLRRVQQWLAGESAEALAATPFP